MNLKTVNKYFITFPFKGDYIQLTIDANYLANRFISYDAEYDFPYDEELFPAPCFKMYDVETKQYINFEIEVKFNGTLNVAYPSSMEDDNLAGTYIEKDVPYLLLKVNNDEIKNDIYNVTEN